MELVFLNMFLAGAGLLLLLFIRALPRLDGAAVERRGVFERWLTSRFPEKLDAAARAVALRLLRRFKVWTLRMDNSLTNRLQRMKLESAEPVGAARVDLKKISSKRTLGSTAEERSKLQA